MLPFAQNKQRPRIRGGGMNMLSMGVEERRIVSALLLRSNDDEVWGAVRDLAKRNLSICRDYQKRTGKPASHFLICIEKPVTPIEAVAFQLTALALSVE